MLLSHLRLGSPGGWAALQDPMTLVAQKGDPEAFFPAVVIQSGTRDSLP